MTSTLSYARKPKQSGKYGRKDSLTMQLAVPKRVQAQHKDIVWIQLVQN